MKALGIGLLSLLPVIFTFRICEEMRLKEKNKWALLSLLQHMHFQIENFLTDQSLIFMQFENQILEKSEFWHDLLQELSDNPCGAFGRAWKNHGEEFPFPVQIREILDHLASNFGFLEKNAQLAELERAIKELEEEAPHSKTECENKIKILRMSGITAGIGILILFI